jgi:hypothetical protein
LAEAVAICAESCERLEAAGIRVIRIGLMSSPSLLQAGQIAAGPWHPAFGFLVRTAIHHQNIERDLPKPGFARHIRIRAPEREIPLVRGYQNVGLKIIAQKTGARVVAVEPDEGIAAGRLEVVEA